MNDLCLAVICAKNPTDILLTTINNVKTYYPEFDIVIIDSNSTDFRIYNDISNVQIYFIKNENYEIGAWYYTLKATEFNKYNIFMFIQDTLIPTKRVIPTKLSDLSENDVYYFRAVFKWAQGGHLDRLAQVYTGTNLENIIVNKNGNDIIVDAAHNSIICRRKIAETMIFPLEEPYINKNLKKSKFDSLLNERTIGLMMEINNVNLNYRKDNNMQHYFKKINGRRK